MRLEIDKSKRRLVGSAVAFLGLVLGLLGLGINFVSIVSPLLAPASDVAGRSFIDALLFFWTFFTHLSNLGLLLVYLSELLPVAWLHWFRLPLTRASMAGNITLVMVYFHFLLAPTLHFTGAMALANNILHYVAPMLYLGWWAIFMKHRVLRFRDVPAMLVPGLTYLAWVLLRGAVTSEYPYAIVDAHTYGYGQVAMGTGILLVAVAVFCTLLVLADRLLPDAPAS